MKKTGTITDTWEAITDFNNQLSIDILVKKQLQERSVVVSTSSNSQSTREETLTGDDYIIKAATPSSSQSIGEEKVAGDNAQPLFEYDEGYEFDNFFKAQDGFMVLWQYSRKRKMFVRSGFMAATSRQIL